MSRSKSGEDAVVLAVVTYLVSHLYREKRREEILGRPAPLMGAEESGIAAAVTSEFDHQLQHQHHEDLDVPEKMGEDALHQRHMGIPYEFYDDLVAIARGLPDCRFVLVDELTDHSTLTEAEHELRFLCRNRKGSLRLIARHFGVSIASISRRVRNLRTFIEAHPPGTRPLLTLDVIRSAIAPKPRGGARTTTRKLSKTALERLAELARQGSRVKEVRTQLLAQFPELNQMGVSMSQVARYVRMANIGGLSTDGIAETIPVRPPKPLQLRSNHGGGPLSLDDEGLCDDHDVDMDEESSESHIIAQTHDTSAQPDLAFQIPDNDTHAHFA